MRNAGAVACHYIHPSRRTAVSLSANRSCIDENVAVRLSAGLRFNEAAEAYDRSRPGYPAEFLEALDPPGDTLEVGCGSGQLTIDLVRRGHRVVGVDPGEQLVALARLKCPDADFVVDRFEEADFRARRFDLVTSATAFHWVQRM